MLFHEDAMLQSVSFKYLSGQLVEMILIYILFSFFIRSALSSMLEKRSSELEVKLLLFAIQKTTTFEKTLAQHFSGSSYLETVIKISLW